MTQHGTANAWLFGCLLSAALVAACGGTSTAMDDDAGTKDGAIDDAGAEDAGRTRCAEGTRSFRPGCTESELGRIESGCYQTCTGESDTSCIADTVCRKTIVDPCVCGRGEACCEACSAERWLCLSEDHSYYLDSLDEVCDGRISGQDVLDATKSEYTATLTYAEGSRTTDLTITRSYDGGPILCQPEIEPSSGSGAPGAGAYVRVIGTVSFTTGDGSFDETLTATLEGSDPTRARLGARLPVDALSGSYEPALTGLDSHGIEFLGQLADGTTGRIEERGTKDGKRESRLVAEWDGGG